MAKTILIGGFGPGISTAVAEKFGKEGFAVALVARNRERLDAGVKALGEKGIKAAAFPADLGDAEAVRAVVAKVRAELGPISVLNWVAYTGSAGDLLTADAAALRSVFDVAVVGLVTAVQEALPDLKKDEESAVLVVNGGLGYFDTEVDKAGVAWGAMGLSIGNSAKHKTVRLLAEKLRGDGVYVGEVVVLVSVKGTPFDNGTATLEPSTIAAKFWEIFKGRKELSVPMK